MSGYARSAYRLTAVPPVANADNATPGNIKGSGIIMLTGRALDYGWGESRITS